MNNPNYKIGLYVRNSDFKQDTPEGTIKNQEQRLRQYVELRNSSCQFGEIKQVYIDRSLSAKNMNRPRLQELIRDISEGKINMIAVSELSRITRNMKDFSILWELFQKHNCGFLSLRENVDTSGAAGEMVMFMLANIAQFERKQTSERVSASRKIRASRGLFNGGVIPLGYQLAPDRPGYLLIEPKGAETVKKSFDYYLKLQALSEAAKALNGDGIKIKRTVQGGGRYSRLDFFTVDNLHKILTNKTYKGVVAYKDGEEMKEAKAVWKGIISKEKFERVQRILKKNCSRKKPFSISRFPYLLSGLTSCESCGDIMNGKSAHGRGGKYGYYEHGWASKKGSVHASETFKCDPHRVSASKLETGVLDNIRFLLENKKFAESVIEEGHRLHKKDNSHKKIRNLQNKISGFNSNLDALTERLAELPKDVSASLLYKQMGKLEKAKKETEDLLQSLQSAKGKSISELPADFADYQRFLKMIAKSLDKAATSEEKARIIRALVYRLEIGKEGVKIHYYAGKEKTKRIDDGFSFAEGSSTLVHGGP